MNHLERSYTIAVVAILAAVLGVLFVSSAGATEQPSVYWTVQCDPPGVQIHASGSPGTEVVWSFGGYPERTFIIGRSGLATDTQLIDGHAESGIAEAVIGSNYFADHVVCECDHSTTTTEGTVPSTTTTTQPTTTSTTRPTPPTSSVPPSSTTTTQPTTTTVTTVPNSSTTTTEPPTTSTSSIPTTTTGPTTSTTSTSVPPTTPTTEPHEDSPVLPDTGGGEQTLMFVVALLSLIGGAGVVGWARR